jgi:ribosomal protein S18 acetylase RimI-like enzyme
MNKNIEVTVAREVTDELAESVNRLLPQLSTTARPIGPESLRRLVSWTGNRLLVARVDGEIVGMLTLVMFPVPTGLRAWIEDVVVDGAMRERGIGAALTREAVRMARGAGARTLDLTSRPSRVAANRLYERLGFRERNSRLYRLSAGTDPDGQRRPAGQSHRVPA